MSTRELLIQELERAPEPLLTEVLDYLRFLEARHNGSISDILLASETALSKDWLRPEEDEAWKDL